MWQGCATRQSRKLVLIMPYLKNVDIALRVPAEYQADYLQGELAYTKEATNEFWAAQENDSLVHIERWRTIVIRLRKEYYDHWFRTGTLLPPEDTSV